jgi:acyl-CoA thioesterase-2
MADFSLDTAVTGEAGRYRATLSPEWEVWGPLGGYVAALALRAMGAESPLRRPASFSCLFLSVARFGAVELAVTTLRQGKRSRALQVQITQEGTPILSAHGWTIAEGSQGFEHDDAKMPSVPKPEELRSFRDLAETYDEWYPVWRAIDGRPAVWRDEPGPPVWHTWMRLCATPNLEDPFLEAARTLMWMDLMMWNAATPPHQPWPVTHLAPNLDLSVLFHGAAPTEEWLLCDAHAPLARDGLVGCHGRVWTRSGRLLASGTSHLFCRPNPQYAEQLRLRREREGSVASQARAGVAGEGERRSDS